MAVVRTSTKLESPSAAPLLQSGSNLPGVLQAGPARTGDHVLIEDLLREVFGGPSPREFQAQLEEPGYCPSQRLVVRDGKRIVAHARISFRHMQVRERAVQVARVFDLATQPEYRGRGLATSLLLACERIARQQGAALMQCRSSQAGLFHRLGWFLCGRASYSQAGPREVLAEMERRRWEEAALASASDELMSLRDRKLPLTVRRWKQTEHAAVQRLFTERFLGITGALERSDAYWRWLIARGAYDALYVAVKGPDRSLFDEIQGHLVGYMFLKRGRIVELATAPSEPEVAESLLARACRDAVEQDALPLRLDAPADHPLHALLLSAGGRLNSESDLNERSFVRVLDSVGLAAAALGRDCRDLRLTLDLHDAPNPRAQQLPSPPQRLVIANGCVTCEPPAARPQLKLTTAVFAHLLLGQISLVDALARQFLPKTTAVHEGLARFFRPVPFWQPVLDDLLAE